ncbi:MAG: exodeoxyribonuclease VII small subunit [Actinomycetaceae bacterium]
MNVRMQHPDSIDPEGAMRAAAEQGSGHAGPEGVRPPQRESDPADADDPAGGPDDDPAEGVAALSYEQARDELVAVVRRLESGDLPLEDALRLWKRGEALADRCQSWLDGARRALDDARGDADDAPTTDA